MTEETGTSRLYDAYQVIEHGNPGEQYDAIIGMTDLLVDVFDMRDHIDNCIVGYRLRFTLDDACEWMVIDTYDMTVTYKDCTVIEGTYLMGDTADRIDDYIGGM